MGDASKSGYDEGYKRGYDEGRREGYDLGYKEGFRQGKEEAYRSSWQSKIDNVRYHAGNILAHLGKLFPKRK